jgi:nitrite reductase/ring-hydroxylating ferredoxin subunit/uncharacterized membrane protein
MSKQSKQTWTLTAPLEDQRFAWLDKLADPVQKGWQAVYDTSKAGRTVKSLLNGTPLRHRMHPAIIIWPAGAWTTAALLDALDLLASRSGNRSFRGGADASVALGLLGAGPAALAGWADWTDLYGHARRVGMAHALTNITAIGLYAASLTFRLRSKERRGLARALSGLGFATIGLGGALGGELVYNLGVNVTHQLYPKPPNKWVDVLASGDLPQGKLVAVDVGRVPVVLLRQDGQILAAESWCPHAGGPLDKGKLEGTVVECPWHQSRFDLRDGAPVQGPASAPLRTFEVREEGGRISVRPSYEGQH